MSGRELYAVQDAYGDVTLLLVAAETPLEAFDRYADHVGVARYSATMAELADEGGAVEDEPVYERPDGLLGAVCSNYEIVARPVRGPVRLSAGQAGYAALDAGGVVLTDAQDSAEAARAAVLEPGVAIEVQS